MSRLDEAKLEAAVAASAEIDRLGLDVSKPIDVFSVIEQERIWLMYQPLDNLLGAYRRTNDNAGILITTRRTVPIQRLTAAHEYGHHILKHMGSVDTDDDIDPQAGSNVIQEVQAQAFAINFLLPPPLIFRLWTFHGYPTDPSKVKREQVYRLSLDLGSTFKSTVVQLAETGKITRRLATIFLDEVPINIKKKLGHGVGPANSQANIWALEPADDGRELYPNPDDEISISLPENPSTGYRWSLVLESDSQEALKVVSDEFEGFNADLFTETTGDEGTRFIRLRALKAGRVALRASLNRPWMKSQRPLRQINASVLISGHPAIGDNGPTRSLGHAFSLRNG
jgi:predicted secreted protein